MTTIITRPRKGSKPWPWFSEEARQRAREYLKSVGHDIDRLPKLVWPDDAVSASQRHRYAKWEYTLKSDITKEKIRRMEESLVRKRQWEVVRKRAVYVWVFWCSGWVFEGYWTYIKGIGRQYHGCGKKGQVACEMLERVFELFPLISEPLFEESKNTYEYYKKWQKLFVKRFAAKKKWCGRKQGKAPVWALVKDGNIIEILSRASVPARRD